MSGRPEYRHRHNRAGSPLLSSWTGGRWWALVFGTRFGMNRPYWLDLVFITGFVLPPVAAAVALTYGAARHFKVSGSSLSVIYLAAVAIAVGLWTLVLIVFSKRTKVERKDEPALSREETGTE